MLLPTLGAACPRAEWQSFDRPTDLQAPSIDED